MTLSCESILSVSERHVLGIVTRSVESRTGPSIRATQIRSRRAAACQSVRLGSSQLAASESGLTRILGYRYERVFVVMVTDWQRVRMLRGGTDTCRRFVSRTALQQRRFRYGAAQNASTSRTRTP
ncbi:unnamed protein product [Rangifer tarandus platyrhynchus]|uniref:Uncharacterized protein n=1 Tax=Rangifer tarandus platyrhynchus TaxID=3082113 RepID=A0ABN8XI56_RANTA|nr:unnamed protein product [Rangifer tarandus platyrhynchus]